MFKKAIVILFLLLGYNNAYAGFTILSDVGNKSCIVEGMTQSECDNDMLCAASQKVCLIAGNELGGLIEGEGIKYIIKYGGQAAVYAGKTISSWGIKSSKSITLELLNKVGNAMKYNKTVSKVGKFKKLDGIEIGKAFVDILFNIAIDTYVDNLSESSMNIVRNSGIPGFKNAPTDAIKKSLKRLLQLSKNNFMFLMSTNKISAAREAVIADGLILVEIGVDVKNSAVEATESVLAAAKSKKTGEVLNLYLNSRKDYFHDERLQHKKYDDILNFEKKCYRIKLTGLESFWSSLKRGKQSLASINGDLRFLCDKYSKEMQEEERSKYDFIRVSTTFDKNNYYKLVKIYFPKSEQYSLKRLYDIDNFDYDMKISKNLQARKFLKRLYAYSGEKNIEYIVKDVLSETNLFSPNIKIKSYMANNLLFDAYLYLYPDLYYNDPLEWQDKNNNNQALVTRGSFAKMLVDTFNLKNKLSKKTIEKSTLYANFSTKWTKEAKFLQGLGIVKGYSGSNDFRPNANISAFEALVMTVDTMDILKCGHLGCDLSNIIGVKK